MAASKQRIANKNAFYLHKDHHKKHNNAVTYVDNIKHNSVLQCAKTLCDFKPVAHRPLSGKMVCTYVCVCLPLRLLKIIHMK